MEKKERVRELLPLVDQIKDKKLKKGVIDVWAKAWEESEWKDLADCTFANDIKDCNLVQHTNFVATAALAMGTFARDNWNMPVDKDLLIAGALLHDVCKVVEHTPVKGKPSKYSAIGDSLLHGTYGVHLALNAGLPLAVSNIISSHTPKDSKIPASVEGVFICHADYAAADAFFVRHGMPLILKSEWQ